MTVDSQGCLLEGNVGPSGDTEWHNGGLSEMTLRGLGWTPRGLGGQTHWTLWGLGCTPRGHSGWTWFLPWGQPSVMMTWMVDWMVEDNLSYCRVVLSCHKYERVKCNIVILLYVKNCYVGQVYWPRVLVIDLVYKE